MGEKRRLLIVSFILSCILYPVAAFSACISWSKVEQDIKGTWAKKYSTEKILKIEQFGESSEYTKMVPTGQKKKDSKTGATLELLVEQEFCSQGANVSVQRANGSKSTFNTSWHYKKTSSGYVFSHHATGEVQDEAQAGQEAPTKDEIKKLVAAAWVRDIKNTDKVRQVKTSAPEFKQHSGRYWYYLEADIYVINESGTNEACDMTNITLYRGKKEEGSSTVYGTGNGPWDIKFVSDYRKCKPE